MYYKKNIYYYYTNAKLYLGVILNSSIDLIIHIIFLKTNIIPLIQYT